MSRQVPWFVAAILAIALTATWFVLKEQIKAMNNELEEMRQKYNQLVADSNQRISDLSKRHKELAERASERIREESLKEVEVQVTFRKALLSSGNVAGFKNLAGSATAMTIDIGRTSSGAKKKFEMTLDPGQNREIGEMEGWAFVGGDSITVSQAGHKSIRLIAP